MNNIGTWCASTDLLADLEAVAAGQHDVEQHEVEGARLDASQRLVPSADGNLMVRDLESGRDRALTTKKTPQEPGYAGFSTVSRDGKWVAFSWEVDAQQQLRVMPTDGSASPASSIPGRRTSSS